MNLGDWNRRVEEPKIDPETGLPEGWTKSEQEMDADENGFVRVNSEKTAILLGIGHIYNEDGDRAGLDLSEPQLVISAQSPEAFEYIRIKLPDLLRTIANNLEHGTVAAETVVEVKPKGEPGTNQQAEE
jgi:hypothetical protein